MEYALRSAQQNYGSLLNIARSVSLRFHLVERVMPVAIDTFTPQHQANVSHLHYPQCKKELSAPARMATFK